jgi:hypothetical protein
MIRVYFNKPNEAPQVWSVDEGSHASEINVQDMPKMPQVYLSCRDQYGGGYGTRTPLKFQNRELFGLSIGHKTPSD